jgi:diguanylate cyclase (GGDEF)-like protein/PAS domain S-box-containing protein
MTYCDAKNHDFITATGEFPAINPGLTLAGYPPAQPVTPVAATGLNSRTLKQVFKLSPIGMAILDLSGRFLSANQALCQVIGYSEKTLLGRPFIKFTYPQDVAALRALGAQLMHGGQQYFQIESRHWNQARELLQAKLTVTLVRDDQQRPICFLVQMLDLTEQKWLESQLEKYAFSDVLTGLTNRALFTNRLEQALSRLERYPDRLCAVLFLDLDRFKGINESLSHSMGDQLLVALSRRLQSCIRRADTLARLGGDEFALLLEDITDLAEVNCVCDRIHHSLKSPFQLNGHEVFTTISIGVACSSRTIDNPSDLMRNADTALDRAKEQGGACHTVFEESMHQRALVLWQIANQSQGACQREELKIRYQPILDLNTGQVVGLEALLRWHHPKQGVISPLEFIPVMEETGSIIETGQWLLAAACKQVRQWQKQLPGEPPLYISINLSPKELTHAPLVEHIQRVLKSTDLAPAHLKLEITESAMMQHPETFLDRLHDLKQLNVGLCIDDFGTGYSSLSRLQIFPIDTLKIDRSFIQPLDRRGKNAGIVKTIIDLASSLGMDVVAEGVETAAQQHQLQELGCAKAQGFYFAKPLTPEATFRFLQSMTDCSAA